MRTELVLTEEDLDHLTDLWNHNRPLPDQYKNVKVYTKHIAHITGKASNSVRYWLHGALEAGIDLGKFADRTSYRRWTLPLGVLWDHRAEIKALHPGRRAED